MEQKYIKYYMYDNGINFILIVVFKFFLLFLDIVIVNQTLIIILQRNFYLLK